MKLGFIKKPSSELSITKKFIQILAVLIYVNGFAALPLLILVISPVILFKLNSCGYLILLIYFTYIYFDNVARFSNNDGQGLLFLIRKSLNNNLQQYFPIKLIKTVDLQANRNYLFASFPHGIGCIGICCNMNKMNDEFRKQFPGIMPRVATLNIYFWLPIIRAIFISKDMVSCSKKSIMNLLNKTNKSDPNNTTIHDFTSNAVVISVGGLKELFETKPGVYSLTLLNRKGFVKIAIETGSPIVPTFTFGEVDLFDEIHLPKNIIFQKFSYIALYYVLVKCFLINKPKRKRLVIVVGSPIEVEKDPNPRPEYVDEIHRKVIDSLQEIFHSHKHKYLENADTAELIIK